MNAQDEFIRRGRQLLAARAEKRLKLTREREELEHGRSSTSRAERAARQSGCAHRFDRWGSCLGCGAIKVE